MTCEDFQALAGAYALGALDPEELAAGEDHLAEPVHRGCEEAIQRAFATVGALASALPPVPPGEGVWRAIQARIGVAAPSAAGVPTRWLAWPGWAGAAAAAVFLVRWMGERREAERSRGAALSAQRGGEAQRQVAALLGAPGSRVVALDPTAGHAGRAVAVVNLTERRALIVSTSLPPAPGKAYQLWVIRGTAAPRPAGFLAPTEGGVLLGQIDPALLALAPDALAVSLEPPGGSPAPTDVQLVGKLKSAG